MITTAALSKRYLIYDRPLDRLRDWCVPGPRRGREYWALREIDLTVPTGSSMGIVGVNGAGKSTLLKILTGTTLPTTGSFSVRGRVSSLLELGTGFHPEFTGRQNLGFGAKMAGLSEDELAARIDDIIGFAELGDFIDQPVRTYSSGMSLRLGFALAASVDPEVLIIDEALSVGDLHFQQKCLARIRQFHEAGATVLFVSHDPSMIQNFCTTAILLDEGRVIDHGSPKSVLEYYSALLAEKYREGGARTRIIRPSAKSAGPKSPPGAIPTAPGSPAAGAAPPNDTPPSATPHAITASAAPITLQHTAGHRTGNFNAVITSVYLDSPGLHGGSPILTTGATADLVVRWTALRPVHDMTVGIAIRDRLGQEIFGVNSRCLDCKLGEVRPGEAILTRFRIAFDLGEGMYSLTAALHSGYAHTEDCYDWVDQALTFQILPNPAERFTGLVRLAPELSIDRAPLDPGEADYAKAINAEEG